jgi:hypothetical protein
MQVQVPFLACWPAGCWPARLLADSLAILGCSSSWRVSVSDWVVDRPVLYAAFRHTLHLDGRVGVNCRRLPHSRRPHSTDLEHDADSCRSDESVFRFRFGVGAGVLSRLLGKGKGGGGCLRLFPRPLSTGLVHRLSFLP